MRWARSIPDLLVTRRGAWAALASAAAVLAAILGFLGGAEPGRGGAAPDDAESTRVARLLDRFPGADEQSLLVVATRGDSADLTPADLESLRRLEVELRAVGPVAPVQVSADRQAALIAVPVTVSTDDALTRATVDGLRDLVREQGPPGLSLSVTGGPAFGVDIAASFDGADLTLLLVTVLIVAVLLVVTYRSPVLWLVPLAVVGAADRAAGTVTAALGSALGLHFDAGIISVLVFGAGTNYALLLISRYREELMTRSDHRRALATAWREVAPAIVASNATVVLSLTTLAIAVIPSTRGLGVSAAVGLLVALAAVLLVLPAALALAGRRAFWPRIPVPGSPARDGRLWRTVAAAVVRRPALTIGVGAVALAAMTTGLVGTSVGIDQAERFRSTSESAAGLEVLAEHFDPGEAQPLVVVARSTDTDRVVAAVEAVDGVRAARPAGTSGDGALARVSVISAYSPGTPSSVRQVSELRDAVHAVPGADALVGGETAVDVDARLGNHRDLLVIAPLVLAVSGLVLLVLLRSLAGPILLLAVNVASAAAAIGAGSWLSRRLLGVDALDVQVPLLAFLFLVALGIDYTIFLVHRVRAEATARATRDAVVEAVARTGTVISSAGVVLAGVFAGLGVLPLVTLGQLGLIVGVGVLVDTLLVRTLLVPALIGLLGERMWWPAAPAGRLREGGHDDVSSPTAAGAR